MKKRVAIALALVTAAGMSQPLMADETRLSVAVGPALTDMKTNIDGLKIDEKLSGINLQLKVERRSTPWGFVASLTRTDKSVSETGFGSRFKADLDYSAWTMGPSYRASKFVTYYGQVGVATAKVNARHSDHGTLKTSDNRTAFGLGLHVQPHRHFFLNAYAQRVGGDMKSNTLSLGLGYMF